MPNITAIVDQTLYEDARVRAARMAAFSCRPKLRPSHPKLSVFFFL
jgi:hypothetical protein